MEKWKEELKKLGNEIRNRENSLKKLKAIIREMKRIQKELEERYKKDIEKENEEQLNQLLISLEKNIKTVRYFLIKNNINNDVDNNWFCQTYLYWNSKLWLRWYYAVQEGKMEDYPHIKPTL